MTYGNRLTARQRDADFRFGVEKMANCDTFGKFACLDKRSLGKNNRLHSDLAKGWREIDRTNPYDGRLRGAAVGVLERRELSWLDACRVVSSD